MAFAPADFATALSSIELVVLRFHTNNRALEDPVYETIGIELPHIEFYYVGTTNERQFKGCPTPRLQCDGSMQ